MTMYATHRSSSFAEVDTSNKFLYLAFLQGGDEHSPVAEKFLTAQLSTTQQLPVELPPSIDGLIAWAEKNFIAVGEQYQSYLAERKAGRPRRYFTNKSHALFFLNAVAPTKLVDGSWLYGLLDHWQDSRAHPLITIYLEELGDGNASKNHVALYKKLLRAEGCENWLDLDDRYFLQGSIQLALASQAKKFLPEIIGFNLGYEQLPLHLLITAYELAELGIDPYYFTLHITIDNLDSGHAKKALHSVIELSKAQPDCDEFYRRVVNGYRLNNLGEGSSSIIKSFNLQQEVIAMFARKGAIGKFMHSDRCKIGGRTINDWLIKPQDISKLLLAFEQFGWIERHRNPTASRFWRLIQGEQPMMFGVFSAPEQQLIYDWIAGDWRPEQKLRRFRPDDADADIPPPNNRKPSEYPNITALPSAHNMHSGALPFSNKEVFMRQLIASMSPDLHATPAGLRATQIYKELLNR